MALHIRRTIRNAHDKPILCMAFNSFRREIYTGSEDGSIRVWDLESNAPPRIFSMHTGFVTGLAFANELRLLISCSLDGRIVVWNQSGSIVQEYRPLPIQPKYSIAWEPHRYKLIVGGNKTVSFFSVNRTFAETQKESLQGVPILEKGCTVRGHQDIVSCLVCTDDKVFTGGFDGFIRVFDLENPERVSHIPRDTAGQLRKAHYGAITNMVIEPDTGWVISASFDGTVRVWSQEGKLLNQLIQLNEAVAGLCYCDITRTVWVSERNNATPPRCFDPRSAVEVGDVSMDGLNLAAKAIGERGPSFQPPPEPKFRNVEEGQLKQTHWMGNDRSKRVSALYYWPEIGEVVGVVGMKTLVFWRYNISLPLTVLRHDSNTPFEAVAVSCTTVDAQIFGCGSDGEVVVWESKQSIPQHYTKTEAGLDVRTHGKRVLACAASDDFGVLALGGSDGRITLWPLGSGSVASENFRSRGLVGFRKREASFKHLPFLASSSSTRVQPLKIEEEIAEDEDSIQDDSSYTDSPLNTGRSIQFTPRGGITVKQNDQSESSRVDTDTDNEQEKTEPERPERKSVVPILLLPEVSEVNDASLFPTADKTLPIAAAGTEAENSEMRVLAYTERIQGVRSGSYAAFTARRMSDRPGISQSDGMKDFEIPSTLDAGSGKVLKPDSGVADKNKEEHNTLDELDRMTRTPFLELGRHSWSPVPSRSATDALRADRDVTGMVVVNHLLISVGIDQCIRSWDVLAFTDSGATGGAHDDDILGIAYSPETDEIATCSADKLIKIWNATPVYSTGQEGEDWLGSPIQRANETGSGSEEQNSPDPSKGSPSGKTVLPPVDVLLEGRETRQSFKFKWSLHGHEDSVNCIAWNSRTNSWVSGSDDGTIRIWSPDGTALEVLTCVGGAVTAIGVDLTAGYLLVGSVDMILRVYDPWRYEILQKNTGHSDIIREVLHIPRKQQYVTASWDSTIRVWHSFKRDRQILYGSRAGAARSSVAQESTVAVPGTRFGPGIIPLTPKNSKKLKSEHPIKKSTTVPKIIRSSSVVTEPTEDKVGPPGSLSYMLSDLHSNLRPSPRFKRAPSFDVSPEQWNRSSSTNSRTDD